MNDKTPRPSPRGRFPWVLAISSVLCCGLFWLVPGAKPNAVFGRLNYFQFYWALSLTLVALAALVVFSLPVARRRPGRLPRVCCRVQSRGGAAGI